MTEALKELIAIPSVKGKPGKAGEPFGREISHALNYVLDWGRTNGFKTKNLSGYAGHIEFGEGKETVGVLVHLDVVPAGEGWIHPPFSGEVEGGRIYGRGAVDDKGPAIAGMYALKALKEAGIKPAKKIRIIFGCDEESGWECMEHYFQHEKKPEYGFTPDANFPLINCEKGHLSLVVEGEFAPIEDGCKLEYISGGSRRNIVPEWAEARLLFSDRQSLHKFQEKIAAQSSEKVLIREKEEENRIILQVKGVPAHASLPQQGDNAITRLVEIISRLNYSGGVWDVIRFIQDCFGKKTNGEGLGIDCQDEISGELTINLGVLQVEKGRARMEIDIRYPLCTDGKSIQKKIEDRLVGYGLKIAEIKDLAPHYLEEDNWLIKVLLNAYREETGDLTPPLAIGGRTYAVTLGNAVAFGPNFPGRLETAHQKNENFSIQDLISCTRIYARTLYELTKK
jgi:succinyl-diaminopimelate desuccinylase